MKVLAYFSALILSARIASADTILLDFSGNHCPPCRQMEPIIAAMERDGYRIERINVEAPENRQKVQQFHVDRIPTFVVLTDGRETDRRVGAQGGDSLRQLLGPVTRPSQPRAPVQTTEPPPTSTAGSPRVTDQALVQRSVRIVVDDAKSRSFGTGTVVRSVRGETLILTCAHLFQGVSRQAKTTVEFFGLADRPRLAAEVLARDPEADVCLVRVVNDRVCPVAAVAGRTAMPANGQPTTSVGCDNGSEPSARHMRVTAINRYVGAPTIECSGEPVEGRSGGGLFNERGDLIGVCSARDPADHRGIYGGLSAIHSLLDRNKLASLYDPKVPAETEVVVASHETGPTVKLPPANAIGLRVDRGLPIPPGAEKAEVVCVIRSVDDPTAPARVVMLNRASPEFMALLQKEQAAQNERATTAMRLPADPIADPSDVVDLRTTDPGSESPGWRSAKLSSVPESEPGSKKSDRTTVQESARWQKDWPVGASSEDGTVRR